MQNLIFSVVIEQQISNAVVKFSGFSTFIDKSTIVSVTKRKRSTEKFIDGHVCIPSQSPFNQQNCGEPDEALTKPSLLRNATDSKFSEKSSMEAKCMVLRN